MLIDFCSRFRSQESLCSLFSCFSFLLQKKVLVVQLLMLELGGVQGPFHRPLNSFWALSRIAWGKVCWFNRSWIRVGIRTTTRDSTVKVFQIINSCSGIWFPVRMLVSLFPLGYWIEVVIPTNSMGDCSDGVESDYMVIHCLSLLTAWRRWKVSSGYHDSKSERWSWEMGRRKAREEGATKGIAVVGSCLMELTW